MHAALTPDQARKKFAEDTDASADLGPARDVAERMALIHAKHEAAVAALRRAEIRREKQREGGSDGHIEV